MNSYMILNLHKIWNKKRGHMPIFLKKIFNPISKRGCFLLKHYYNMKHLKICGYELSTYSRFQTFLKVKTFANGLPTAISQVQTLAKD